MFKFCRKFLRTGVVATLVGGTVLFGAMAALGEGRTKAALRQMQSSLTEAVDEHIQDPVALRSQLIEMEKEYPQRIAEVRSDLAELREEIRQIDRDRTISERVVELADRDLAALEGALVERTALAANGQDGLVRKVTFRERPISVERALSKKQQIERTKAQYASQAFDASHALGYLQQQETRLEQVLGELENERQQFRAQIQQLSQQVDAIARNERLIKLLEKRNKTIEECSRYEPASLENIQGRLAAIQSRQEAELDLLSQTKDQVDYEQEARLEILSSAQSYSAPMAEISDFGVQARCLETSRN